MCQGNAGGRAGRDRYTSGSPCCQCFIWVKHEGFGHAGSLTWPDHPWALTLPQVLFGTVEESLCSKYHRMKKIMVLHGNVNHLIQYLATLTGAKHWSYLGIFQKHSLSLGNATLLKWRFLLGTCQFWWNFLKKSFHGRIGFLVKMPKREREICFHSSRKVNRLLGQDMQTQIHTQSTFLDLAAQLSGWVPGQSVCCSQLTSASSVRAILHSLNNYGCRNMSPSPNKAWDSAKLLLLSWPNIIYSLGMQSLQWVAIPHLALVCAPKSQ